jgi:hypothetical protein
MNLPKCHSEKRTQVELRGNWHSMAAVTGRTQEARGSSGTEKPKACGFIEHAAHALSLHRPSESCSYSRSGQRIPGAAPCRGGPLCTLSRSPTRRRGKLSLSLDELRPTTKVPFSKPKYMRRSGIPGKSTPDLAHEKTKGWAKISGFNPCFPVLIPPLSAHGDHRHTCGRWGSGRLVAASCRRTGERRGGGGLVRGQGTKTRARLSSRALE